MVGTPQNIRRFEVLSLISIFIGLVQSFLDGSLIGNIVRAENSNLLGAARGQAVGAAIGGAVGYVVGVAIFIALTLLVSRRRKNWARWILLV